MKLQCVECNSLYELDINDRCPQCKSDKSIVVSEIDPYYVESIRKTSRIIIIANACGALSLVLLLLKILISS